MQANLQTWVTEANFKLKNLGAAGADSMKVLAAIDLTNHVLSLLTDERLNSPEDVMGEHIHELKNAERFDSWFHNHPDFAGPKAAFEVFDGQSPKLEAKLYWLKKRSNALMAGAVHFTPNWEDAEWTRKDPYKVGIDFFLSQDSRSLHIALSNYGKLRVLELRERLTNTDIEVLSKWHNLTFDSNREALHATIWDSFKLQSVNSKFYNGVADAFTELHDHLVTIGKSEDDAKMFASRLLGRLIFVWFVRKMNLISQDMKYFDAAEVDQTEYYKTALEGLFFRTLNTPIENRTSYEGGSIDLETPYLNGGLFAPRDDDWQNEELKFPDGYFSRLYDHFNNFNFTTDESTPEYEQVAIDPEMLGRVFESLLASQVEETGDQARKAKGTFYTPRDIVGFMCKQVVKTQLEAIDPSDVRVKIAASKLVDTSDQHWSTASSNNLRDIPSDLRRKFIESLNELKTLDPACGSGAFPLGLLQLLTKLQLRLDPKLDEYTVKLSILQNNIFGVDIEPMAVEISRLRSWLSLIVEEKNKDHVEPLPNLDFNFVCANSLIGLKEADLFTNPKIQDQLDDLRRKYFTAKSPEIKKSIQVKYLSLTQPDLFDELDERSTQLKTFNPFEPERVAAFFDSQTMFGIKEFDVVVGNPPYVRQEKINYKSKLKNYKVFSSTSDLYTYFYELGLENLKKGGSLSYITSSKFGRALYGEKLRSLLAQETSLESIVDFGDKHVFTAITNTWVVSLTKTHPKNQTIKIFPSIEDEFVDYPQAKLSSGPWAFVDLETSEILEKIESGRATLGSDVRYKIFYGLKTGCNEGFVIDEKIRTDLLNLDSRNEILIKPLLKGRDVGRYAIKPISSWILATKNGLEISSNFPTIANYLNAKNTELEGRLVARSDKGSHWHNLRDCAYYSDMESEKIVWLELSDKNKFAFSNKGEYILAGAWMLNGPNLRALLGILNSKLVLFYFNHVSNSSGMGTTQWKKFAVERIPIPDLSTLSAMKLQKLERLVTELEANPEDTHIQGELDQEVFDIYGLSDEEVQVVIQNQ